MAIFPIALFGLGVLAWQWLTGKDDQPAMVGADASGAFDSYPKGCTGDPRVKAVSVPSGGVYRVSVWECGNVPYSHYAVAQGHLSRSWIGFKVSPSGKRKFWRGDGSPAEINRMCVDLGVTR
jgi:hypothetical protein